MKPHPLSAASSAALALCMAACASAPQDTFYTLQPLPQQVPQAVTFAQPTRAPTQSVVVGPVNLPPLVDRPQWVLRRNASEVRVLEHQRWAHPLDEDMAQAVAAHISALVKAPAYAQTNSGGPAFPTKPTVRVQLNVLRFTSLLDPVPHVDDQFQWAATCVGPSSNEAANAKPSPLPPTTTGLFTSKPSSATTEQNSVDTYAQIAAAHANALQSASKDIADAVQALLPQCPAP